MIAYGAISSRDHIQTVVGMESLRVATSLPLGFENAIMEMPI